MAIAQVDFRERLWMWGEDVDQPRFLHVALRIKDPERSLRFYIDGCGLKLFDGSTSLRWERPCCSSVLRATITGLAG